MAQQQQRTLVLIKPDAMQRELAGQVLSRLEATGLRIVAMKLLHMDRELAHRHYEAHVGKPFFDDLVELITSSPLIAMVLQGKEAIEVVRKVMGATDPVQAAPGTIRGDLALDIGRNLVHGSDSPEAAEREVALFFEPGEIQDLPRGVDRWITGP